MLEILLTQMRREGFELTVSPPKVLFQKDKNGKNIPKRIINKFLVKFNGKQVFGMDLEPSISTNPYIAFPFKAKESGTFDFEWTDDNGEKYTMSRKMTVS